MFILQTHAEPSPPILVKPESRAVADHTMARLRIYQLSQEDKTLIKKIAGDPLKGKEMAIAFANMLIKNVGDEYDRVMLERFMDKIVDNRAAYPDVWVGFLKFLDYAEKGGKVSYQNLMRISFVNVKNAGNIVTPVIVKQGDGAFVTPKSNVDGLYTSFAYACTIAVTICKDPGGKVIRVGMAHIDPRMSEGDVKKFFSNSTKGGTTDAYIFGGRYNDSFSDNFSGMDKIANSVQGVKVRFYSEDRLIDVIFGNEDDAAYVDKNGKLYYGHISSLDDPKKAAKLDAWRSHVGPDISIKHY